MGQVKWNLDLTKRQETGDNGSLYQSFVITRFFSTHYTIAGLKNIVCCIEDIVM